MLPHPVDETALIAAYDGIDGKIEAYTQDGQRCVSMEGDWGWIRFEYDYDQEAVESMISHLSDEEIIQIYTAISQPSFLHVEFSEFGCEKAILERFPLRDNVLVSSACYADTTIEEILRRIDYEIDVMFLGGDSDKAELAIRPENWAADLVVLDDERIVGHAARDLYLKRKLDWCVGNWFFIAPRSVEVICAYPPTETMRNITELHIAQGSAKVVPVRFVTLDQFSAEHGFSPRDLLSLRPGQPGRQTSRKQPRKSFQDRATLITRQPLDLDVLARVYSDLGQVERTSTALAVRGEWGDFSIDIAQSEHLLQQFENAELIDICTFIGDPMFAELQFANPPAADKAIERFPVGKDDVLLDNGMLMLMTVAEAQYRLQYGIAWRSWGGELQPVDLIVRYPDNPSRVALVWVEDERLADGAPRDILFERKMDYSARYVHDPDAPCFGDFALDYPDLAGKALAIEFVYAHPPTEKMKQTTEARPHRNSELAVPVHLSSRAEFIARFGFDPTSFPSLRKV